MKIITEVTTIKEGLQLDTTVKAGGKVMKTSNVIHMDFILFTCVIDAVMQDHTKKMKQFYVSRIKGAR